MLAKPGMTPGSREICFFAQMSDRHNCTGQIIIEGPEIHGIRMEAALHLHEV